MSALLAALLALASPAAAITRTGLASGTANVNGAAIAPSSATIGVGGGAGCLVVGSTAAYFDCLNSRLGVNMQSPLMNLDVVGTAQISGSSFTVTSTRAADEFVLSVGTGSTAPHVFDVSTGGWVAIGIASATQQAFPPSWQGSLMVSSSVFIGNNGSGSLIINGGAGGVQKTAFTIDDNGSLTVGVSPNRSNFNTQGSLTITSGSNITLSGANGFVLAPGSSVTAGGFVGNGAQITHLAPGNLDSGNLASGVTVPGGQVTQTVASAVLPSTVAYTPSGGFSAGAIPFAASAQVFSQDAAHLFWDSTNGALCVGAANCFSEFYVKSTTGGFVVAVSSQNGFGMFGVNANGFVGIGTGASGQTPATKLHMSSGTLTIDGTVNPGIKVNVSGNSPAATFTPNLSSSTASGALSGTFTSSTLGPAIAGSSITLNLPVGEPVLVGFNGAISDGNLAAVVIVGVIVDGGFVNNETNAKGLTSAQQAVVGDTENFSFTTLVTGLSAGSHTFALVASVSAGTGTIDSTNSSAQLWAKMEP